MKKNNSFIKFLGTAGARFVMIEQLRSSGGIWLSYKDTNFIIDPGPGSLVKCVKSRPKLDPRKLDAVLLTHKHLDHSNDVNVMVEAMTEGGFKKRGSLFIPADALGSQGVVFSYLHDHPEKIVFWKTGKQYVIKDIKFCSITRNHHSVETHGLKFFLGNTIIGFVSDTKYFPRLETIYKGSDILILNVVFFQPRPQYEHLSLPEAINLVEKIKPRQAIFTHFGRSILKEKPHLLEQRVRKQTGKNIIFARDGMSLQIGDGK
jgi:ribonuclease BN (tRNA processing enzyme)